MNRNHRHDGCQGGACVIRILDGMVRLIAGVALTVVVVWLLRRGPLVAPVSLFDSVGSTSAFYSASHAVALAALIGAGVWLWAAVRGRLALPGRRLALAFGLPLAALVLATAQAVYPHDARYDLEIALAMGALYYASVFVAGEVRGPGLGVAVTALLASLAAAGLPLAIDGLRQYASGIPTGVAWTGIFAREIPIRVSATTHDPNALAAYLLVSLGATVVLILTCDRLWLRVALLVLVATLTATIVLTFSRAGWLATALFCLTITVLTRPDRRRWAAVSAAVAAATFLALGWAIPGVFFRAGTISIQNGGDVTSRFFGWLTALSIWRTHPLLGTGAGGLNALYAVRQLLGWHGTYVLIDVPGSDDNDVLQWLVGTGVVGLLALATGLGLAAWTVGQAVRRAASAQAAVVAGCAAVLLGLALQGTLEVTAFLLPLQALLAVLIGTTVAASGVVHELKLSWARRGGAALLAAGCLWLAVGLHQAWLPERLFQQMWQDFGQSVTPSTLSLAERVVALDPTSERNLAAAGDVAYNLAYGAKGSVRTADVAIAISDLRRALAVDPFDGNTWGIAADVAGLEPNHRTTACLREVSIRTNPYDVWDIAELASNLLAAGEPGAARIDGAYASWIFPLELDVYAEHDDTTTPYYHQAEELEAEGEAGWKGPLPHAAVYPLGPEQCGPLVAAEGFSASAFLRAWNRGV